MSFISVGGLIGGEPDPGPRPDLETWTGWDGDEGEDPDEDADDEEGAEKTTVEIVERFTDKDVKYVRVRFRHPGNPPSNEKVYLYLDGE